MAVVDQRTICECVCANTVLRIARARARVGSLSIYLIERALYTHSTCAIETSPHTGGGEASLGHHCDPHMWGRARARDAPGAAHLGPGREP